ncbi:hypothetical protein Slin15195_G112490 [Septoria linicola]|uniref:Uncharacterized protein n=1 Tax=Septoria linicola TaxID=215465 RepID=A0A9Q9EPB3_9PEZI|nr:hypothetical protein Slin15195_G112490 [Septoria linicola]
MASATDDVQQVAALISSMNPSKLRQVRTLAQRELSKICHFLDELPKELRLQIYDEVLVELYDWWRLALWKDGHEVDTTQVPIRIHRYWRQPALLLTCKQIRAEALPLYLERNTFIVDCHYHDPTALLKFYQNAKKHTKKYKELNIMIEMDRGTITDQDWQNVWWWLRMYFEGVVPYRPRFGVDQIEDEDEQPLKQKFISAMFDMLEKLHKAGCAWSIVQGVLMDAYEGVNLFTHWDL